MSPIRDIGPVGASLAAMMAAQLVVFAASSLRDAFQELGRQFEAAHPAAKVVFNFAGSQELRTQLEHGADADVLASADQAQMHALESSGLVSGARIFARNEPVLVVPSGNPARIRSLRDLAQAERIVLGAPEVPIGAYTRRILDAASRLYGAGFRRSVEARVVSRELNVRQVLAKVRLGEADAAIVYRTDALAAAGSVSAITIPPELNAIAEYPLAALRSSRDAPLAGAFVNFVLSPAGHAVLSRFGFL
jgi:molybdate transport system substrate-binding protein